MRVRFSWLAVMMLGCGSGGGGGALPDGGTGPGGGGTTGTVKDCNVSLTANVPSAKTGASIAVTARVDAKVVEGTKERIITNDTSITSFEWTLPAGLDDVPTSGVNTKRSFTSRVPGDYELVVTSKLSPTCTAKKTLTFTGTNLNEPFQAGTYDVSTFKAVVRATSSPGSCTPPAGMKLTITKDNDKYFGAIDGEATCASKVITCNAFTVELAAGGTAKFVSGNCAFAYNGGVAYPATIQSASAQSQSGFGSNGKTFYVFKLAINDMASSFSEAELSFEGP